MKTNLLVFVFILFTLRCFGQNLQALDDKNGFRNAKFGMSPSSFNKLEQVKEPPLVGFGVQEKDIDRTKVYPVPGVYYDKDVDLHIGAYPLEYVKYYFYKNKLVTIEIEVSRHLTNKNGVLEILEIAYGKGMSKQVFNSSLSTESYTVCTWEGEKVKMIYTLQSDLAFYSNKIFITNKELKNWEEADRPIEAQKEEQRKKQAMQDAAKKL